MKTRERNWLVGVCLAGGPAIIGLTAAQAGINSLLPVAVPQILFTYAQVFGVAIFFFGVAVWVFIRVPTPTLLPQYECYRARESELPEVRALATKFLGDDVSRLERMVMWHRKNPNCFRVVYRVRRGISSKSKELVGYFCVIPLNQSGIDKLMEREITGAEFNKSHVSSPNREAKAVYVGGLVASGLFARGSTQSVLQHDLQSYWSEKAPVAYTTPTTDDGLRLVRKYGFSLARQGDSDGVDRLYYKPLSS